MKLFFVVVVVVVGSRTVPSIITFLLERWCQRLFILICYLLKNFSSSFFFLFSFFFLLPSLESSSRKKKKWKNLWLHKFVFNCPHWYYTIHSSFYYFSLLFFYLHDAIFHENNFSDNHWFRWLIICSHQFWL